jgi:hypothetical protein
MASVLSPPAQKQTKSSLAATHPFTCNTCLVAFRALEAQRSHYHTDWQYVSILSLRFVLRALFYPI